MQYTVEVENDKYQVTQNEAVNLDIVQSDKNKYHLLDQLKSYNIELYEISDKRVHIAINGNEHIVNIADEYDQLIEKMGLSLISNARLTSIKAPMPGLVLEVLVEPGQEVSAGDSLIILEAMKMQNVLKSNGEGVVKSIEVAQGAAVDKGQILIEMV